MFSPPVSWAIPVTFPPGRARLATSPALTGSALLAMTIGMVVVAFMAATVFTLFPATMTSTPSPTRSAASADSRSHVAVGKAVLDDDILANAVAEAPQAIFERLHEMERSLPRRDREVTHPVDPPCRLLRARGQRPRRRAAETCEKLASLHEEIPRARGVLSQGAASAPYNRLITNRLPTIKR